MQAWELADVDLMIQTQLNELHNSKLSEVWKSAAVLRDASIQGGGSFTLTNVRICEGMS